MIEERWTKSKISDIAKHLAIQESRNKDADARSTLVLRFAQLQRTRL